MDVLLGSSGQPFTQGAQMHSTILSAKSWASLLGPTAAMVEQLCLPRRSLLLFAPTGSIPAFAVSSASIAPTAVPTTVGCQSLITPSSSCPHQPHHQSHSQLRVQSSMTHHQSQPTHSHPFARSLVPCPRASNTRSLVRARVHSR